MAFTDRFIKLPIKTISASIAEFAKPEQWDDNWEAINPFEISSYRPSSSDDGTDTKYVNIDMKNGDEIFAYLTPEQFEALLNKHFYENNQ
jgi:hypothetical protein